MSSTGRRALWAGPCARTAYTGNAGLDFVRGFLACLYAGAIAVPAPFGRSKSMKLRLSAIAQDCKPRALLTIDEPGALNRKSEEGSDPLAGLLRVQANRIEEPAAGAPTEWPLPPAHALAFLQYTSSVTPRSPKLAFPDLEPGVCACSPQHEVLIPSLDEMRLTIGARNFELFLFKNVPLVLERNLPSFVRRLCAKAGRDFEREKHCP